MTNEVPNVIAISYAKRALVAESRERVRMREYAGVLGQYHLIVFSRADDAVPAEQHEGKLSVYGTASKHRFGMLIDSYRIGSRILSQNPDEMFVVSAQDPFESALVALWLSFSKNAQLHTQIHGDIFNPRFFQNALVGSIKKCFALMVLRRAKKIRVVSDRIKKSLIRRRISADRIEVVPIQSDLETFMQVGSARVYRTDAPPVFLYVGRFAPEKNLSMLLSAFAAAATDYPEAVLQLVGEGPLQDALQRQATLSGIADRVRFIPWSNDIAATMAKADVLCLTSDHEGFAMVLVEAMAAGLAVISTDVGCVGEWIEPEREALVVPPRNVSAYTDALMQLMRNPSRIEQLGRNGHKTAEARRLSQMEYLHAIQNSFRI